MQAYIMFTDSSGTSQQIPAPSLFDEVVSADSIQQVGDQWVMAFTLSDESIVRMVLPAEAGRMDWTFDSIRYL